MAKGCSACPSYPRPWGSRDRGRGREGRGERGEKADGIRGGKKGREAFQSIDPFFKLPNQHWTRTGSAALCSLWEVLETRVFQISECFFHVRTFA